MSEKPDANGWMDFGSTPKDGTRILACGIQNCPVDIIRYSAGLWINPYGYSVRVTRHTDWQPIPPAKVEG